MTLHASALRRIGPCCIALFATACLDSTPTSPPPFKLEDAKITAKPGTPTQTIALGWTMLGLGATRDGRVYVPAGYDPATPAPLVVMLHSAEHHSGEWQTDQVAQLADEFGFVILAPDSRGRTWDALRGGAFGPDPAFINQAMAWVYDRINIRPDKVVLAGFSDGASYALSLGIINGDVFDHLIAWSPALVFSPERHGEPFIFISHGTNDGSVGISVSRNTIVPSLRNAGYTVEFVEFDGGHFIPFDVAHAAFTWMLNTAR